MSCEIGGACTLNYYKHLKDLEKIQFSELACPHCGAQVKSASGKEAVCNFCEQYVGVPGEEFHGGAEAKTAFLEMHEAISKGLWSDASGKVERLIQGSSDPRLLYVSAVFYLYYSDLRYRARDYNLMGFMEENYESIREGLNLTSRRKEHFYNAIVLINAEMQSSVQVDEELLFIKFMSEIKLNRLVDASTTLKRLNTLNKQDLLSDYASMVYCVEAMTNEAENSLSKMLEKKEANAFYYLAKYLANEKGLDSAKTVLEKLSQKANVFMSPSLLNKIRAVQEASKL